MNDMKFICDQKDENNNCLCASVVNPTCDIDWYCEYRNQCKACVYKYSCEAWGFTRSCVKCINNIQP